jgi:hypothetical protein
MGTVSPPPSYRLSAEISSFFNKKEEGRFAPAPALGTVSVYKHSSKDQQEHWHAVCLGYALGEIGSADALRTRVVEPLLNAAKSQGLLT